MTDDDYYKHIYKLAFIVRYSNMYRVRDEDVAQHSFFVAAIILKLYETYEFKLESTLIAAISHDIMEADVSDVTHDIKERYPTLQKGISDAERGELSKYPKLIRMGFNTFEDLSTPEGLIANLADVLQVRQYIKMEEMLGNTTLGQIGRDSSERTYKLKEELKPYERNNTTNTKKEESDLRQLFRRLQT